MTPKILVVDDEPDVELLITQRFRKEIRAKEMSFLFVQSGESALSTLEEHPEVEMVLSDINMPGMDGLTLLSRLKDLRRLLKVIIVSAYGDLGNIRTAMNRGAFDFITKPISFDDLRATIRKTEGELAVLKEAQAKRREAETSRDFIRDTFNKYVPESVAEAILADRGILRPRLREATILFTDIAGFTAIAQRMEPESLLGMLNDYFSRLAEVITRNGGVINQFQGDAILATFNVPVEDPDHAIQALRVAWEINAISESETFAGLPLVTRIGINTGPVVAGSVGGPSRLHYTVHGDAVNLAARLEQLNKEMGSRVLIAESCARQAMKTFDLKSLGKRPLRGLSEEVELFTFADLSVA